MNQVCLSMKKFSRSSDVKSFISSNVLEHVFSDISTKQQKLPETVGELLNGEEADILASKRKSPINRQIVVTSDEVFLHFLNNCYLFYYRIILTSKKMNLSIVS